MERVMEGMKRGRRERGKKMSKGRGESRFLREGERGGKEREEGEYQERRERRKRGRIGR